MKNRFKKWIGNFFAPDSNRGITAKEIQAENVANTQYKIKKAYFGKKEDDDRPQSLRQAYLYKLMCNTGMLPLEGIDPKAMACETTGQLSLGAVYTALLTHDAEREGGEDGFGSGREHRRVSVLTHLDRHQHIVLLGDPGSGKSTFVNFVSLCLAGEALKDESINISLLTQPLPDGEGKDQEERQPWRHGPLLPVRIILRDFAAQGFLKDSPCAAQLWAFIKSELESAQLIDFEPQLERELRDKGGLILLDGLDEVSEAENRRYQIKQVVQDFISSFPKCRVMVTSRTYAYQKQDWQISGLKEVVLSPFSKGQIIRFIDCWYGYIAQLRGWNEADAQGKAELLKRAVFGGNRLRELAERPLLLTLMASLHAWRGGSLPEKREELYADAVELLMDRWESEKIIRDASGKILSIESSLAEFLKVDKDSIRELLEQLAFDAHSKQTEMVGTADIDEKDLIVGLVKISSKENKIDPNELIQFLNYRAGLLIPRGVGVYTFPHRTFQEYLAACHLTDQDFPDGISELARDAPDRWREVALLAGAKAATGAASNVWSLASSLCYTEPKAPEASIDDYWGALLAGEALVESAKLGKISPSNQKKLERIRKWQVEIIEGDRLPAIERALSGRSLSVLGDHREAITALEKMEFCLVPDHPFQMGDGKERHPNDHLSYDYWMARHPVTNAQYARFVDAGGYGQSQYWKEAEKAGWWKDGKVKYWQDDQFYDKPIDYGTPFNLGNHPVVGITWYEALAFTLWLTDVWQAQGLLDQDRRIRLPSEAEWEKAARGGLKILESPIIFPAAEKAWENKVTLVDNEAPERVYPWGDKIDKEKANFSDTGIGTTSALGCFCSSASPYGCLDMAGNVWEWTRSLWGKDYSKPDYKYPYVPTPERENASAGPEILRVLRGGAFFLTADLARCAYRYGNYPNYRYSYTGFRCVCAPNTSVL